ncbi:MAG TPA: magnesium transporter [Firmicutes bacterium]|nr:magnesium transporter [Bacillota bacterium]
MKNTEKKNIIELINLNKWAALQEILKEWHEADVADLLLELDSHSRILLFRSLPRKFKAMVFSYLEPQDQKSLLFELSHQETSELLSNLNPDDRTLLLEELPAEMTRKLMDLLSPEDLKEAWHLLGYPEESVGRLMTPDYVSVSEHLKISEVIKHIRRVGKDSETINIIYVVDKGKHLLGTVKLREVILCEPDRVIKDIMHTSFGVLSAFDDQEKAVSIIKQYDLVALPVVDSEGVLLGIVTIDDILDIAEDETTEDIQKGASVEPLGVSYHNAGVFLLTRKRVVWLIALIVVNLFSSGVIALYEDVISKIVILAAFIPLLIDSGGNVGSQSATLMIRALVTGDIEMKEWFVTLLKELRVGLLLGIAMGGLSSLLGFFRGDYMIGFVLAATMLCIVLVANLIGMSLPFVLGKLRMDPAMASGPLISTIMDILGLLIYFSIASAVLL